MTKSKVTEVEIETNYLIYKNSNQVTYADNFRFTSYELDYFPEPKDLMIAFFLSFPKSFKFLLNIREFIAKFFGLKTAPKTEKESRLKELYQFKGDIGDKIAIFEVQDKNKNELLTGQKDSHLDFKLSFLSFKSNNAIRLELATTVIINNTLGKIYFKIVKPFHKFYLKRILKKMEIELINKSW